ncbi:CLUMA_CG017500, isoform A [Clunio marinus]|uniref:Microsomal glutathione S-transferase 1 n=1 Tax=Clunio marinus TaxID=568069 RepID=A0A1J1IZ22_9DIPT|nr:CLUMA_CG017500, isoform A [Clunio marinus]
MTELFEIFNMENHVFRVYVFWVTVLVFKMLLMPVLTVYQRVKNKSVASPEDSPKGIVLCSEDVESIRRAHRNDLENIPQFIVVAFFYLMTNPSPFIATNLIRIVGIARIIYTIAYAIDPKLPARGLSFLASLIITTYMSISVLIYFY